MGNYIIQEVVICYIKLFTMTHTCKLHGETEHYVYGSRYRCKKCNIVAVTRRRKELKLKSIKYLGGSCKDCNLEDPCPAIYDFHHLDPSKKDFNISRKGYTYSWDKVKKELDKCILLCSNCHRKRHFKEESFPDKKYDDTPKLCKCGKRIVRKSKNCNSCTNRSKINWPTSSQLKFELSSKSYVQLAKELGVSDNAIRKRLKSHP